MFAGINLPQIILKLLLTGVIAFVLLIFCLIVFMILRRLLAIEGAQRHTVKLSNQGNVNSYFKLTIESKESALKYKLLADNVPLAEVHSVEVMEVAAVQTPSAAAAPHPAVPSKQPKAAKTSQAQDPSLKNVADSASKSGKEVAQKGGALASVLGTLGSILPGSAGKALKEQSEAARSVQTKTVKAMQAPESAQMKVESLQKDSSKLGVKTSSQPAAVGEQKLTRRDPEPEYAQEQPLQAAPQQIKPVVKKDQPYCVQTKEVAPGDQLNLVLCIDSKQRRLPEGSFIYTIKSQQIPVEKLDREAPIISGQGVVHFKHVESWRYWLPFLLNGTLFLFAFLAMIYFISLVWLAG